MKTEDARQAWVRECRSKQNLFRSKRQSYWLKQTLACKGNSRKLWRIVDSMLSKDVNNSSDRTLSASDLAHAFQTKVLDVRNATAHAPPPDLVPTAQNFNGFTEITVDDVEKLITTSNSKFSVVDPIPVWLFKDCVKELAPFITVLFNKSLLTGDFPSIYKVASVTPILKKPQLDPTLSSNYRPISNLQYISKLLERVVLSQILTYLNINNLFPQYQSAYRQFHSTETAVSKVLSDIYKASDQGYCSLLCMLDLSSAFDSVDTDILLSRLRLCFGFSEGPLAWVQSYLDNREQYVCHNEEVSHTVSLNCGVPQGSVLGPVLFLLYTSEVLNIIEQQGFSVHAYADDLQIYAYTTKAHRHLLKQRLSDCVLSVKTWMDSNRLKLNPSKTELIWLGSARKYSDIYDDSLRLCGSEIRFSKTVKNLGVIIDNSLTLNTHINSIIRSSYFALRELWHIRPSLTPELAKTLACSFVHSRLDYCNSVLAGLTKTQFSKLDRVLKASARFVFNIPKFSPVSQNMVSILHWLPFPQRVEYKLSQLGYKSLHERAPNYIASMYRSVESTLYRSRLRSAALHEVMVPSVRTDMFGKRSMCYAGPAQWNRLPVSLRNPSLSLEQFSSQLKTFLFRTVSV